MSGCHLLSIIASFIFFRFKLETGNLLERVSEKCPFNLTGADFYALCSDAWMNAVKKKIHLLDQGTRISFTFKLQEAT